MAAKQAAANYDKANVIVIETKTIAQCYSALSLIGEDDIDTMVDVINSAVENVTSLEVTYAVRDSQIDQFNIKKNDYLGFMDHKMTTVSKTKLDSIKDLFDNISDLDEKEVVTILYGVDVTEEELKNVNINKELTVWFDLCLNWLKNLGF